jgi:hypothetical protein
MFVDDMMIVDWTWYGVVQGERDRLQQTLTDLKFGDKHAVSKMEIAMHSLQQKVRFDEMLHFFLTIGCMSVMATRRS